MTKIQRRAFILGIFTLVMLCLTVVQLLPVAAHVEGKRVRVVGSPCR
jgi:hypothetical protein